MSLRELLPPERMVTWPPLFERALKGERFRAEITLIDGRILDLSFSPIVLDGETTGVSVFGKDITVHKRAMQALQESEERFRRFFEENSSVMLMLTPE
jgi:PAS domain-containing protein